MPSPVILFEDSRWQQFLPLVYLRGLFELRCGIGELWQRVERVAMEDSDVAEVALWCREELTDLVAEQTARSVNQPAGDGCLLINGRGFWSLPPTVDPQESAWVGTAGRNDDVACIWVDAVVAAQFSPEVMRDDDALAEATRDLPRRDVSHLVALFDWPWEVVHFNASAIEADWRLAGLHGTRFASAGVHLLNPGEIHIGAGTRVKPCVVIDAEDGPVWIGANVTIEPHACIQGPCYVGNETLIQPGAVVREGCSFGCRCKVGGEVEASIVHSFTNKQHDGFLGHAYLGQWINLGADCLNSDLKNTYGTIRVPINGRDVETGEQFVGMLMGDFSKTGINVAFSTGAVVGVCSNVVVPTPPKFTPSFTWLDGHSQRPYDVDRAVTSARRMMARRQRDVTPALETAIRRVSQQSRELESSPT